MKRISLYTGRFALTGVAAAALALTAIDAQALGLGRMAVQSALGESLRAEIDITSITPEEAGNLRVKVAPPESYRAAGVEYNPVLPNTQVVLMRRPDGRQYLRITSDRSVQEPFVDVILELSWSTGRLVREYTMLFDPPVTRAQAPATTTSPVISSPAPAQAAAPAPAAPRPIERRPPAPRAPATADSGSAPAPRAAGADEYRVRPGDTLSRVARSTQRPGVSLDQMLVSLYRGNPQAFIDNNMNRLKAGAVLAVPAADAAKAVSGTEAREVIQAQSADFGTYRQRLAGAVPSAQTGSTRQAGGKVTTAVEDRKPAASTTPDKLTLSKGSAASTASAAEDRASRERQRTDDSKRVAELSRNVEDLKRLSGAASAASAKAPAAAPVPPVAAPPKVVAAAPPPPAPVPPPPPPAPPPAPAPAPVVAAPPPPPPAPVPPPPASAPVAPVVAPPPIVAAASEPASAPPVVAAAPAPVAPPPAVRPPAPPIVDSGASGSFFDDNPLPLALGGALIVALAGYGAYRYTRRAKKDSGETSFLESRLQPDSFFGASGGQRIDTRDAGGASSSMSYSLSQLDAIGDVDPVAEADVYLAYGRDLQAEEILKEAMRSSPERLAIRTKLLEVYAKRRDTKGFELLATQLYGLTRGEGEDWAKTQELGAQIDPDNPLYQPGGAPVLSGGPDERVTEPLGASTMPQSVLPTPSRFEAAAAEEAARAHAAAAAVDLDLEIDLNAPPLPAVDTRPSPLSDETLPLKGAFSPKTPAYQAPDSLPTLPDFKPPPPSADIPMDFDLSAITLDLDEKPVITRPQSLDTGGNDLATIDFSTDEDDDSDPLARKLELAEEFRQIGDNEGARDLLQEVVAKADGALRAKAQGMLDELG